LSIALLMNVPIKVKFIEGGMSEAVLKTDPLAALFGDYYEDWIGGPDGLIVELDASLSETHELTASTSQHPIEDGSLVSDNYTPHPQRLTIEGTITDTPVQYLSAVTSGMGGLGSVTNWAGIMPTSINAWLLLKALWKSGAPFDVSTGFDLYKSMTITRLVVPRSAKIGRQLLFTAELEQKLILKKESMKPGEDLLTTEKDLGYLTHQIPDAVSILAAAVFIALIVDGYV